MAKEPIILFPKVEKILTRLGENIRLARLRRNITMKLQAERAGISLMTLSKIEKGAPTVAIGNYMQVLFSLNLAEDVAKVAADDELGRKFQDIGLLVPKRAAKEKKNE